jgi:hypothetical protein
VDLKIISSKGSQNVKKDSNKEMKGKSKKEKELIAQSVNAYSGPAEVVS